MSTMSYSLNNRAEVSLEALKELPLPHGNVVVYPAMDSADADKFNFIASEYHVPRMLSGVNFRPSFQALQTALFGDADHLLQRLAIRNLVLEETRPTGLAELGKTVEKVGFKNAMREQKNLAGQKGLYNPHYHELIGTAVDPRLESGERRERFKDSIGRASNPIILEGIYRDCQDIQVVGAELAEQKRERVKLQADVEDYRKLLKADTMNVLKVGGVEVKLSEALRRARAGDAVAVRDYTVFRNHMIKQVLETCVQKNLIEANQHAMANTAHLQGSSLFIYGMYHTSGLIQDLRSRGTVVHIDHTPLIAAVYESVEKAPLENPSDIYSSEGFKRWFLAALPEI